MTKTTKPLTPVATRWAARLRDSGMSDRQIAAAVGVSQPTVSRSFSDTDVSEDDLDPERDDDVLTEAEWQQSADDDDESEPDIMAGHPDPGRYLLGRTRRPLASQLPRT